ILLDSHARLPTERRGILNRLEARRRRAVEDDVEPEVVTEPLSRPVFVRRQPHLPEAGAALDLDESRGDECAGLRWMRLAREQVVAPALGLDALDDPTQR